VPFPTNGILGNFSFDSGRAPALKSNQAAGSQWGAAFRLELEMTIPGDTSHPIESGVSLPPPLIRGPIQDRIGPWLRRFAAYLALISLFAFLVFTLGSARYGNWHRFLNIMRGRTLLVEPPSIQLTSTQSSAPREVPFSVWNGSNQTIRLLGAESGCECALIKPAWPIEIEPGRHVPLALSLQPVGQPGARTVSVLIHTDHPRIRRLSFQIKRSP
jgi:hypothetical protein